MRLNPPKSRHDAMSSDALKVIYKSVVLTKLLYASPALWGFTTLADKQQLEAFLHRGVRLNLYRALNPSVSQRVQDTDDELFSAVMANSHHVLHHMLPDHTSHTLWPRRHDCSLTIKEDARNFVIRLLYKDM